MFYLFPCMHCDQQLTSENCEHVVKLLKLEVSCTSRKYFVKGIWEKKKKKCLLDKVIPRAKVLAKWLISGWCKFQFSITKNSLTFKIALFHFFTAFASAHANYSVSELCVYL